MILASFFIVVSRRVILMENIIFQFCKMGLFQEFLHLIGPELYNYNKNLFFYRFEDNL